jgi:hypothetical protein
MREGVEAVSVVDSLLDVEIVICEAASAAIPA